MAADSRSSTDNNATTKKQAAQVHVDKILTRAGLQASPFDPLSLQALHEYLEQQESDETKSSIKGGEQQQTMTSPPPSSEQVDIYSPPAAGTTAAAREDRLMEQLQLQTSLILDLQRKIETLSGRVKELENGGNTTTFETTGLRRRRVTIPERQADADEVPVAPLRNHVAAAPPPQQQQQQQQPRLARAANREARLTRLVRVF